MECMICNKDFSSYKEVRRFAQLSIHIKKDHSMDLESYILKYKHNGVRPTCECGCGALTGFSKGVYNKFLGDHSKHRVISKEQKKAISDSLYKRFESNYKKIGLSKELLQDYWEKYQSPLYPAYKISEISGHDFRTISSWWIKLKIASKNTIREIAKKHQLVYSNQGDKNGQYVHIDDATLEFIFKYLDYLKAQKRTTSYEKLIELYDLKVSAWILKKRISSFSVNDYSTVFKGSMASKPETKYLDMLSFFLGDCNVKRIYKLGDRYYDGCLFNKILIEFDGDFWHPKDEDDHPILSKEDVLKIKNNDKYKDELAIKHGFKIYRIRESESKDISKLNDLIKLIAEEVGLEKIQVNKA